MFVRAFSFLASLRLTVVLLALSIILVFFGTLGQVTDGLYDAQARYFKSWFTTWQPTAGSWFHLPLPGGYLLGTSLLVNLLAAHYKRFKFTWKKSGIFLTHIGIVLLLVGQLATDMFATESYLRVEEGETRNYSEGHRENELAVIDVTDATTERVVAFPETSVVKGNTLSHPSLPFQIRVRDYAPNSSYSPRGPRSGGEPQAPVVDIEGAKAISGSTSWLVTPYASDRGLSLFVLRNLMSDFGPELGNTLGKTLTAPQEFTVENRRYQITLRPTRYYTPHAVELLAFKHDKYIGTEKAKDFRSRVRLHDPTAARPREVDIYMNNPLRFAGLTYFQSSFDEFDPNARATVLQVVKNPSWVAPYVGCIVVGAGMTIQFLIHLVAFIVRKASPSAPKAPVPAVA
jgi:hypothetical protein